MVDAATLIGALPRKDRYRITEIVPPVAVMLSISHNAVRLRIYRGICDGKIRATRHLGSMMIPRDEVLKMLNGEDPDEI